MPTRGTVASIAQVEPTEQLKKPLRRGSGTRRHKGPHLYQMEMQFLDAPSTTEETVTPPPALPPQPPKTPPREQAQDTRHSQQATPAPSPTQTVTPDGALLPETPIPAPTAPTPLVTASPSPNIAAGHNPNDSTEQASLSASVNNPPKPGAESSPPGGVIMVGGIGFHHASEAEFARLLNYYGIEWEYEPNQFPLQWRDGRPVEMFSPDFYLTEFDLYIELTTMRQSLVRRKNRKLRLIRALYPEVNIKLLYRRDYQRLLQRFGIPQEEVDAEMDTTPTGDSESED